MSDDLLLHVRLAALETNLRRVRTLAATLRANSETLASLHGLLADTSELRTELMRTRTLLGNIAQFAEVDQDLRAALDRYGQIQPMAEQNKRLVALGPQLKKAATKLDRLRIRAEEAANLLPEEQVNEVFEHTGNLLLAVGRLRTEIAGGNPTAEQWQAFRKLMVQDELSEFGDYVDVAGGLTLRGTGLDEQFCAMADALAAQWNGAGMVKAPLFSIPARNEATRMSRFIRLGFPEWTVWAVPLFACEFGRILVGQDDELMRFARDAAPLVSQSAPQAAAEEWVRVYLADAFATYVMGPAYAYASLLLKLDPTGGSESIPGAQSRRHDTTRAAVSLRALQESGDDLDGKLVAAADGLSAAWTSAVEQFGTPIVPLDDRVVEKVVLRAMEALAAMDELSNRRLHFDDQAWAKAETKARELFLDLPETAADEHDEADEVDEDLPLSDVSLAHVLNAAWHARITDPAATERIADRMTRAVWPSLKKARGSRSTRFGLAGPRS